MSTLPTPLRRQLETAIERARRIAEGGARKALEALAVHEPHPYEHMNEGQRKLRDKLRAQAKQLGDGESRSLHGAYEIRHLVEKLAYDHWHRILFARFLLENNLLISPEHEVSVTLDDCEELAPALGLRDCWAVAAQFAAKELPEIFRSDDPAGAVELPVEDRNQLVQLVTGLPVEVFTAKDSLGWCYQFWQAERKDEVNAAGIKIGADELPAVTQLFTEDYMVDFLLDNTLGAWHASKVLAANPTLAESAEGEEELRNAVAVPGCPWSYLRFIKGEDAKWAPAAGAFKAWPKSVNELKCLDPCMGSGHFIVAMFERLVALRIVEEQVDEAATVAAVIRDNLFGLEVDPRCAQIAAFNLALVAWRRVGQCKLPDVNLACSGLAPNTSEADWLAIAGNNEKLRNGMHRVYTLFRQAPVIGSLIDPRAADGNLIVAGFQELQPLLEEALGREAQDDASHELAVTAKGIAQAAEILAGEYSLVATNVPYLGQRRQDPRLEEYCQRFHPLAKADLATCFLQRCLSLCQASGTTALVTPQNWTFLKSYKGLREDLLRSTEWRFMARLGTQAFETITGEVVSVSLLAASRIRPNQNELFGIDVSDAPTPSEKAGRLVSSSVILLPQKQQLLNPDSRIVLGESATKPLLKSIAAASAGMLTGDGNQFCHYFWEPQSVLPDWECLQSTVNATVPYGGRSQVVLWENGKGRLYRYVESVKHLNTAAQRWRTGQDVWGKMGIVVSCMGSLHCTLYLGDRYDNNVGVISPFDESHLPAVWAFCSSPEFQVELRRIDQKVNITAATFAKVPFDLAHWQKVAAERYPDGIPKPFSSDPTQWLFDGNPKDSDQPLHVAVARLLGYQWPRQNGSSFPDCHALGPDGLHQLVDDDGIVCLSPTKGEEPGAERLRKLLVQSLGDFDVSALIASAGPKGSKSATLDDWLRDEFFEQHCGIFDHRPFIWHIWDGHKTGFSALVNYHKLTHANLETLTYAYLGDWIRRQQAAVEAGESGSDARLQAAKQLQARLKLILEGEPPFDIFVRWKPLSKQAIGWGPDLNDGVRLNIRPFLAQDIPGGKRGAGILRVRPNIKWDKDRGGEPARDKDEFPWFWGWDGKTQDFTGVGKEPDGNRWNDCHYSNEFKRKARERVSRND